MSLNDSPISKLPNETELSSGDLFIISKNDGLNTPTYKSKHIEYDTMVCNIVSSMGNSISATTISELSDILGGTVTLNIWKDYN